jgi:hypothetical protein
MGKLKIMNGSGHTTVEYTEEDSTEAQSRFDELQDAGYLTFKVNGSEGTQVKKFDPSEEEHVVMPPMAGGQR